MNDTLGIYIHWPFCLSKCPYCAFTSLPVAGREKSLEEHADTLVKELTVRASSFSDLTVETIYFGGGTPSLMSPAQFGNVMSALRDRFDLSSAVEVSLEANPESVTLEHMSAFADAGVNRVSLGVQSLHDHELAALGRIHSAERALNAVQDIRSAGILNVSVDLIFGFRDQSLSSFTSSVMQAADLGIPHISLYGLSLDAGSKFTKDGRADVLVSSDDAADMYINAAEMLALRGFEHYEISSFCLPGARSKHNERYWKRQPYLGAGVGAASFFGGCRTRNVSDLLSYISSAGVHGMPDIEEHEILSPEQDFEEQIFLGLRRKEGLPVDLLSATGPGQAVLKVLEELAKPGLVELNDRASLTTKGFLLSNEVFARCLVALDRTTSGPVL